MKISILYLDLFARGMEKIMLQLRLLLNNKKANLLSNSLHTILKYNKFNVKQTSIDMIIL